MFMYLHSENVCGKIEKVPKRLFLKMVTLDFAPSRVTTCFSIGTYVRTQETLLVLFQNVEQVLQSVFSNAVQNRAF
jgi:hypothetical protein